MKFPSVRRLLPKVNASPMTFLAIMLYLLPLAPCATHPEEPKKRDNTLLTGVVVSRSDNLLNVQIPVRIYRNGVRIAEIIPENGMFVLDLKGLADQDDLIEVVVWPERINRYERHSGKSVRTNLAHAQNLSLQISYGKSRNQRNHHPPSRGIKTLYINYI